MKDLIQPVLKLKADYESSPRDRHRTVSKTPQQPPSLPSSSLQVLLSRPTQSHSSQESAAQHPSAMMTMDQLIPIDSASGTFTSITGSTSPTQSLTCSRPMPSSFEFSSHPVVHASQDETANRQFGKSAAITLHTTSSGISKQSSRAITPQRYSRFKASEFVSVEDGRVNNNNDEKVSNKNCPIHKMSDHINTVLDVLEE